MDRVDKITPFFVTYGYNGRCNTLWTALPLTSNQQVKEKFRIAFPVLFPMQFGGNRRCGHPNILILSITCLSVQLFLPRNQSD